MHPTSIMNIRLTRVTNRDGDVIFRFTTVDGRVAGYSQGSVEFVMFDDPAGPVNFNYISEIRLMFSEWSGRDFFSETDMRKMTGRRFTESERIRLQLNALNRELIERQVPFTVKAWIPETGEFTIEGTEF